MASSTFEDAVRAELADAIADDRLRVVDTRYDRQAFGNASVTMAGGGVLVRLLIDRGDVYGDIARETEPGEWYPLQHAIAAVRGGDPSEGPFTMQGFAADLRQHWSKLVHAFGPGWDSTKRQIERAIAISNARFVEQARRITERGRKSRGDGK